TMLTQGLKAEVRIYQGREHRHDEPGRRHEINERQAKADEPPLAIVPFPQKTPFLDICVLHNCIHSEKTRDRESPPENGQQDSERRKQPQWHSDQPPEDEQATYPDGVPC